MGLLSCERQHTSKQFFILRSYQRDVRELWMVPWASGKVIQRKCFQSLPACQCKGRLHLVEAVGWIRQSDLETLGGRNFYSGEKGWLEHIKSYPPGQSRSVSVQLPDLTVWVYIVCVLLACPALLTCLMWARANTLCFRCSRQSQLEFMAIVPRKQLLERGILVKIVLEFRLLVGCWGKITKDR